ncbi:phage baseplate assembly protein V [Candidatus Chloroploca sp. M-50]|uniref:Phage baseplate assembly protein V n=1 Tax=Candidatus Chloroploca mongolica TaxID=2528176 RepID=A0ABS4DA26_9CHLR|nr:phage baseplate assembly protein V [Candidatus Chloroploca mongolica]MBP1466292.1 phage baseplate assembly protein V [Candidatus Chloroploca mongolica]
MVQQQLSLPCQCELVFVDPPQHLSAAHRLAPGTSLRIRVPDQRDPLFVGEITALEYTYDPAGGRELRVRGYDLLHRLRKRQSVRSHVQVSLYDLAQELVADIGLTVDATEHGPLWQQRIQARQSDLELLTTIADACGLYVVVREHVLHLLTLAGIGEAVPLILRETLFEARIELNGDPACRVVETLGWNPLRIEQFTASATTPRSRRSVRAEVLPDQVGGNGIRTMVDEVTQDNSHTEAMACAELDRQTAREVTFWGIADGDTRLQPGTPVEVRGVDDHLAGTYVLTAVKHTIDHQMGFVSELSTMPPMPAPRPHSTVTTIGIVSRVDDPDHLGRVRIVFPTYNDVESEWLGVLAIAAGQNKGLMALPDVGDHVLVLLPHEDPAQGIVLGGLYGMGGVPDSGINERSVRQYTLLTRGGQRIRLDDVGNLIRLENSDGSYLELSPEKLLLHAATDLDLEAPGRLVTIRGQFINFERG